MRKHNPDEPDLDDSDDDELDTTDYYHAEHDERTLPRKSVQPEPALRRTRESVKPKRVKKGR